jgi:1,4-alpha-glucan branching enzyme
LTNTLRYHKPSAALIAEYWGEQRWKAVAPPMDNAGMGFDLGYADGLRDSVREVLRQAATGGDASVDIGRLRTGLYRPVNVAEAWRAYNCIENHDLLLDAPGDHRQPRIPQLAHWDNTRSWLARSRSRVATGVLLTAPGVPMLFMGQEFLADRWWSDDPHRADLLIRWADLQGRDRHAGDFHRFTRDLLQLRRHHPALRSEPVNVYHNDNLNRVLAYHRWLPGRRPRRSRHRKPARTDLLRPQLRNRLSRPRSLARSVQQRRLRPFREPVGPRQPRWHRC